MEQLVSMGFSGDLAAQALSATGGDSPEKAVDWILAQTPPNHNNNNNSKTPSFQPSLDRFFRSPDPTTVGPTASPPKRRRIRSDPAAQPLAERMRPRTLDGVLGQDHLSPLLRSAAAARRLPSLILWGPPGSGKTSLARALASASSSRLVALSAVSAGVREVRDAVEDARRTAAATVLFIDEVHRFSRTQLDSLLPAIEDGTVSLLGATTENPSFHLTAPLLSRCRVAVLRPLAPAAVAALLRRAAASEGLEVADEAVGFISERCDGDARVALNALEAAAAAMSESPAAAVGLEAVKEALQCKHLVYDKAGDEHYNLISALHKSMRGSDADAAIYWLARMLEGGEEPLYIARRLIRFASEDVGLADPLALNQAVACYQACHFLGMPECNVVLAQCAAYLALAPKSVAVYRAIGAAQKAVRESAGQNEGVPLHLRNAPTKLMMDIGYGKGYVYTPDDPSSFQSFLPKSLEGSKFLDWPDRGGSER